MDRYSRIYAWVRKIPRGRVATYGQIAALAGFEGHARQVGYALHNLPEKNDVPWHRVINAKGEVSPRSSGDSHELQRHLLEGEGVELTLAGRIDLGKFGWERRARSEEWKVMKQKVVKQKVMEQKVMEQKVMKRK
jgi:methylated-DNA-protein-cysteine methyltransferase-like protein